MKATYEVHKLTGSTLVDADGYGYANESAGVLSRHKTREAAERKAAELRRVSPTPVEVREVTR